MDVDTLAHTKWNCIYHIVFIPKYRRKSMYGKVKKDINEILRKLCEYKGVEIVGGAVCALVDMVSMWINNYWANQSYWVSFVERDFGQENTERLDGEIFKRTAKIQAQSLKKLLGLGDDMQTMAFVLKHITTQWPPAGFDWTIDEVTDERVVFHVNACPMGTYRKAHGLEVFHCKRVAPPLYDAVVKAINPRMKAICTHAHPDETVEGLMCSWVIQYE